MRRHWTLSILATAICLMVFCGGPNVRSFTVVNSPYGVPYVLEDSRGKARLLKDAKGKPLIVVHTLTIADNPSQTKLEVAKKGADSLSTLVGDFMFTIYGREVNDSTALHTCVRQQYTKIKNLHRKFLPDGSVEIDDTLYREKLEKIRDCAGVL